MIIKKKKLGEEPSRKILNFLGWKTVFLQEPSRDKENSEGPCQSLQKAGSWREYILALERDDQDPSSNKREGDSQCKILPKRSIGERHYFAHVHAKNTLIKILIGKKYYGLEKGKKKKN